MGKGRKKKTSKPEDKRKSPVPCVAFKTEDSATSISSDQLTSTQASSLTSSFAAVSSSNYHSYPSHGGSAVFRSGGAGSNLDHVPPGDSGAGSHLSEDAVGGGVVGAARQRAAHAHAVAAHASQDANEIDSALIVLCQHHKKLFLQKAFGLNLDGTKITDPSLLPIKVKKYNAVKSVDEYNYMIHCLLNWGEDDNNNDVNQSIYDNDPRMVALRKFCK